MQEFASRGNHPALIGPRLAYAVHRESMVIAADEMCPDRTVVRVSQLRVRFNHIPRLPLRLREEILVGQEICESKDPVTSVLLTPEQITLSPYPQICARDFEAVDGVPEDPQSLKCILTGLSNQNAVTLCGTTPDPSA